MAAAGVVSRAGRAYLSDMSIRTQSPSRRDFIAAATAAGAALAAPGASASVPTLPRVGLGSWITFNVGGDPVLLERSADVIAAFADAGGGMIDSSPMYGSSQATIGYGLAKLGDASAIYAADKVWTGSVADGPAQIEASRAAWRIGRFDLLQVHNLVAWRGHLATLREMKAAGRLGRVGVTTSHGRRHEELEEILRTEPLDFVQLTYNAADREAEARLLPIARERGVAVIVNRPFRRGELTRRLARAPLPPVAEALGAQSWAQLLLLFALSHPAVTTAIPATTRVDHVRENKAVEALRAPDDRERREIVAAVTAA